MSSRKDPAAEEMAERLEEVLALVQQWGERALDIALGGPVGLLPTPEILDVAASHVSTALSSERFPVRLNNVDLTDVALSRALIVIALAPFIWNVVGRLEYHTRAISRVIGRWLGAYSLALWIFSFSLYRDLLFLAAIESQPKVSQLGKPAFVVTGSILYGVGIILVVTSMLRLGITGTYLGDYFGILMESKVTAFPYNLFDNPMYDGATACFLGKALLYVAIYGKACIVEGAFGFGV